jgi:hypothetical protein
VNRGRAEKTDRRARLYSVEESSCPVACVACGACPLLHRDYTQSCSTTSKTRQHIQDVRTCRVQQLCELPEQDAPLSLERGREERRCTCPAAVIPPAVCCVLCARLPSAANHSAINYRPPNRSLKCVRTTVAYVELSACPAGSVASERRRVAVGLDVLTTTY